VKGFARDGAPLTVLRVAVALLLFVHGAARAFFGGIEPFGRFLASRGLPSGYPIAMTLTAVELAGGAALALGYFVVPLCAWFALELMAGIALVHFPEGWFVVGAGRNGMEYSVLLIVSLFAIAAARTSKRERPGE
jgi:putative oxidoreductase